MEGPKAQAPRHIFEGQADGQAAAEWLNRKGRTKAGRAVVKLIGDIRELTPEIPPSLFGFLTQEESGMSRRQYVAALNQLNQRLVEYATWPMFVRRSTRVRKWGKNLAAEARTEFHWRWSHGYNPATPIVHSIVRLGERGLFHRLKQCTLCKKWLYARFAHQSYCSSRCRQKHFKSTPEWRAMRREYMRKHRQDLREREAREIALVRHAQNFTRTNKSE